jgi:hypothetical protein
MTTISATDLLKMANADASSYVIYGAEALHHLRMANEYFRAEDGLPESEWAPVTASMIRTCVKSAYRASGK